MNKKTVFSVVLLAALVGLTCFFLLKDQNMPLLMQTIVGMDFRYILLGLGMMLLFICCEAVNNSMVLGSLGYRLKPLQAVKYAMIGFYFSSITPSSSGGQPAQVYYMSKDKIQMGHSSLSLLILVMFYQIVMLGSGTVLFLLYGQSIKGSIGSNIGLLILYGFLINLFLISMILLMIWKSDWLKKWLTGLIGFLQKLKVVKNPEKLLAGVEKQIEAYKQGAMYLRKKPLLMLGLLLVTIVQINVMFCVPFAVYKAFHLTGESFLRMLAVQALLTIAVSSLPIPGAAGASETGFLAVFALFFPTHLIIPAMLIWRGITYYFYLAVGGIVTVVQQIHLGFRNRTKVKTLA